jgi:uncharacterized protein YndB with AHSA1/START domain
MKAMETTRAVETEIEIGAPREAVWAALTEADELTNWFPLEAVVEPGVGGKLVSGWGEEQHACRIDEWVPNERLVLSNETPDADGKLVFEQIYTLSGAGETTRLHLVHSGFGPDARWDWLYDATRRGWSFELKGLRHYLERHLGTKREVIHATRFLDQVDEGTWEKLTGKDGLCAEGTLAGLEPGDRFAITTSRGDELQGKVWLSGPPRDFAGIVSNANDAYLRLRLDNSCTQPGRSEVNLWLSTYGLPRADRERLGDGFEAVLTGLFGA